MADASPLSSAAAVAVRTLDHVKLSLFLAALGSRADSQGLVRGVLFIDEET